MNTLTFDEAFDRVGRAIYGSDWIFSLSQRQMWLIEHYEKGIGASNVPGTITYFVVGGKSYANWPASVALLNEVEHAQDRRDWHEQQRKHIFQWFVENDFDIEFDTIDEVLLRKALHAQGLLLPVSRLAQHDALKDAHLNASPHAEEDDVVVASNALPRTTRLVSTTQEESVVSKEDELGSLKIIDLEEAILILSSIDLDVTHDIQGRQHSLTSHNVQLFFRERKYKIGVNKAQKALRRVKGAGPGRPANIMTKNDGS